MQISMLKAMKDTEKVQLGPIPQFIAQQSLVIGAWALILSLTSRLANLMSLAKLLNYSKPPIFSSVKWGDNKRICTSKHLALCLRQ